MNAILRSRKAVSRDSTAVGRGDVSRDRRGVGYRRSHHTAAPSQRLSKVCADVDGGAAERVSSDLSAGQLEPSVLAIELDVTSAASWSAAVAQATAFGALRGLVNNAGITRDKSMLSMPEASFDDVLRVHVKGSWLGCRACIPELRKTSGASIVNISSRWHGVFGQVERFAGEGGNRRLDKDGGDRAGPPRHSMQCSCSRCDRHADDRCGAGGRS